MLPGIQYRLLPVPGIEEGGDLQVKGASVMSGYLRYENPGVLQPPKSELGAGWYDTGDIVRIDEDGFIHVLGRVKRFAKVAGEMVSLEAVENLARAASPKSEHAAVSLPDAKRGESIILFTTDRDLSLNLLRQAAKRLGVTELSVPRQLKTLSKLPLLGNGKTDYVSLREGAMA
jgi:acyl-[acyl-carrier-protein]-phospholipid O-acyltransferase/long-chain-fatty-acid--[acyl-carrier-protein] ligase